MENDKEGHIYLLQINDEKGNKVYKLGKSKDIVSRLKNYKFKNILLTLACDDCKKLEDELLLLLKNKYKIISGREYFECNNEKELVKYILQYIINIDNIDNKIYSVINEHNMYEYKKNIEKEFTEKYCDKINYLEELNNDKYNLIIELNAKKNKLEKINLDTIEKNNKVIEDYKLEKIELNKVIEDYKLENNELNKNIKDYELKKIELNKVIEDYELQKLDLNKIIKDYELKKIEFNKNIKDYELKNSELNKKNKDYELKKIEFNKDTEVKNNNNIKLIINDIIDFNTVDNLNVKSFYLCYRCGFISKQRIGMIRHLNRTYKCIIKNNVKMYSNTELNDLSMKRIRVNDKNNINEDNDDDDNYDGDDNDDDCDNEDINNENNNSKNICIYCNKKFTRAGSLKRHLLLNRCSKK